MRARRYDPTSGARIALFVPSLFGGGAERSMAQLASGMAERGIATDLLLTRARGPYLSEVHQGVRLIDLKASRVSASVAPLVRYLRRERPVALLSTLNHANIAAIVATRIAGVRTRAIVRQANTFSMSMRGSSRSTAYLMPPLVRHLYPLADAIVAVTEGVATDLATRTRLPSDRIKVIPNPVITPDLMALAVKRPDHPWLADQAAPVILAVGRLTPQKDFITLVRAFELLRRRRPVRLIILGEGEERPRLERLAGELGVEQDVSLPGFVSNPFAYMSAASVFALTSAWEGLPGALIQALACGMQIVATDCGSGPRVIVANGRFGRLVPVGDVSAVAKALEMALTQPAGAAPPEAWRDYTQDSVVERYLTLFRAGDN